MRDGDLALYPDHDPFADDRPSSRSHTGEPDVIHLVVDFTGIAVTDLRLLIEMQGIKELGGKVLLLEAPDQLENVAPELRGHRSETELDSPEVLEWRYAHPASPGRSQGFQKILSFKPTP